MTINLLTDEAGAIRALADMEGEPWLSRQLAEWFDSLVGLKHAIAWLAGRPRNQTHEIYGNGGMNRYFVRSDGEVCFSRMHACYPGRKTIAKAEALGFVLV